MDAAASTQKYQRNQAIGSSVGTVDPIPDPTVKPAWHYAYSDPVMLVQSPGTTVMSGEINQAAGLAWEVTQVPAYIYTGDPAPELDANGYVVETNIGHAFKLVAPAAAKASTSEPAFLLNVRDDSNAVLGVVKKRYRVFQNHEAPIIFDHIAESGEMRYETAGALYGGAEVWWLLKSFEAAEVAGDPRERLDSYLLLANSHDGSKGMTISALMLRVASQTTLAWPVPTAARTRGLRHTDSSKDQEIHAQQAIELATAHALEVTELGQRMLETTVTDQTFVSFLEQLVPTPKPRPGSKGTPSPRGITMASNAKGLITQVYYNNQTQSHLIGTLWGVVQACQFYSDHFTINRNTDGATADENRFKRLTADSNLGAQAFTLALSMI